MDGAEIRTLRKGLGLTQEEFAHEIGVTFATVNRWENGKSKPSRLAVRILAELKDRTAASGKARSRKKAKKLATPKGRTRRRR